MNHPVAAFDDKRRRAVGARLKHYTAEQLCRAIDGCRASPWHRGANDRNRIYDDLELICRDAKHVDDFIREHAERAAPAPSTQETPRERAERRAREEAERAGAQ
jgi:hypothetical protein